MGSKAPNGGCAGISMIRHKGFSKLGGAKVSEKEVWEKRMTEGGNVSTCNREVFSEGQIVLSVTIKDCVLVWSENSSKFTGLKIGRGFSGIQNISRYA